MESFNLLPTFGNILYTVAAYVVALSIIVTVHEYGHYIVGRLCRIQAEVFSLGFGRPLWSRTDRRGTRWQIAAVPLGGYVKFLGDAGAASARPDDATMSHLSDRERRRTMHGAPLWARAATVVAGPAFNFIFSILIFATLFLWQGVAVKEPTVAELYPLPGQEIGLKPGDRILAVGGTATPDYDALATAGEDLPSADRFDYLVRRGEAELTVSGPPVTPARAGAVIFPSAAHDAGLKKGDVVLSVDGVPMRDFIELQRAVRAANGAAVTLVVWRQGAERRVTMTPRVTEMPKRDGGFDRQVLIGLNADFFFAPATERAGPARAFGAAADQTWFVIRSSMSGLWHMVTGAISTCNLSGPIRIAETSGVAAKLGLLDFIAFIAALSTAVGLINLFPIPMLDGGHLLFYVWEWARGKPPPERFVNAALTAGLVIVAALLAFGLTNDIFCP
ncbi:MAG: RIP metalloprotease RseP [Paracoccaceae bacterium]